MSKKILVLDAHPRKQSFSGTLAQAYLDAIPAGNERKILKLSSMDFNPDLSQGYASETSLEPSLKAFQKALTWCQHFVIVTPIWWGTTPAKLKGLFDRTFLPGFAFKYEKGKLIPRKLLSGRTANIIMTMDTPPWYYRLFQGSPAVKQLKKPTLEFVGFKPVNTTMIGPIINSTEKAREQWLAQISQQGRSTQ